MSDSPAFHRLPRARIDPIDTPYRALAIIIEMMDPSIVSETIVVVVDRDRRGMSIVCVSDTHDDDSMLGIVDALTCQAGSNTELGGLIVASVRPGGGVDFDDLDRWQEAAELCTQAGVELIEWFVLGTAISCPRQLCDEPPRWVA